MNRSSEGRRLPRLKAWILAVSMAPAAVSLILRSYPYAAGFAAGGIIILLNLIGSERTVRQFLEGSALAKAMAVLIQFAKLLGTAAALGGLVYFEFVSPLALLIGLSALPAGLMFDFFIFPVNKGEEKES